jgi:Na+/H+-dicarboxylate symporter
MAGQNASSTSSASRSPYRGESDKKESLRGVPFYITIVIAMVLGLLVGPLLGSRAAPLGEVGKLVIQLIKAVATPLLFFAIVNAILETRIDGKSALRMIGIAIFNASVALTIGLAVSNVIRPGEHLTLSGEVGSASAYADKKVDFIKTLVSYIPSSIVTPFAENAVISVILIALLTGFGLRRVRSDREARGESIAAIEDVFKTLLSLTEVVLTWIIKLIPLAVFAVAAKTVGEHGYGPLRGLAYYVAAGLIGFSLHVGVTYQILVALVAKIPLSRFWREAREPVFTAMGTNSSLATLPVTLKALDRLQVSKKSSALGACVGTNLNNDGIILYEGMAVLFVAQASGIPMTFSQQLTAAITCMVAAMGVAGIPEAGFISLAVVVNTVGLPIEILPLLLSVDWILARARSMVNVLSDMVLSILLDRTTSRAVSEAPS